MSMRILYKRLKKTPLPKRNLFSVLRIVNEYISAITEMDLVKEYDIEDNVRAGWVVSWSEVEEAYAIKEKQQRRYLL